MNSWPTQEAGTSSYSPIVDAATLDIGTHVGGAGAAWADPDNTGQRFVDNIPTVLVVRKGDQPQLRVQKTWIDGGTIEVFAETGHVDRQGNLVGQILRAEDLVDEFRCVEANKIWEAVDSIEQIPLDRLGNAHALDPRQYGFCREPLWSEVGVTTLFGAASDVDCPVGSYWDAGTECLEYTNAELLDGTAETAETVLERWNLAESCLAIGDHYETNAAGGLVVGYTTVTNVPTSAFVVENGGSGYSVGDAVALDDSDVVITVLAVTNYNVTNDETGGVVTSFEFTSGTSATADGAVTGAADEVGKCIVSTVPANFSLANFNFLTTSSELDYAKTTCIQFGHRWNPTLRTCIADNAHGGYVTKATCVDNGHVWIAGTCYDGADFGDGMNRDGSFQQDPTQKPK